VIRIISEQKGLNLLSLYVQIILFMHISRRKSAYARNFVQYATVTVSLLASLPFQSCHDIQASC